MKNRIAFILFLLLTWNGIGYAQERALVIIDIQDFYFPGGAMPLVEPEAAAENAALLLGQFRGSDDMVIHITHKYQPGGEIFHLVTPVPGENVIMKENVNAFVDTPLDSLLRAHGINELVLCGMQTHMCLEAATRAASDLGYHCTVAGDACATRDLSFEGKEVPAEQVHLSTLSTLGSYARVVMTGDLLPDR